MTNNVKEKVFTLTELKRRIAGWRLCSDSIVFTNGCFDLLHLGHIDYLSDAKTLGDRLIVGINSNASVKKLKGESRPINDAESRAVMLASFFFVDAVCIFDEDTPLELITTITPDVLVKGGDYELNQIVGHDVVVKEGGIVKTMPFLEGYSSSDIVSRIKGD